MFYEKYDFDEISIFPKRHIFGLKRGFFPRGLELKEDMYGEA